MSGCTTTSGHTRALLLSVALCLAAGPAAAQDPKARANEQRRTESLLRERNRETMNPAEDPLVVVGLEQGGNDLRSKTPALLKSDKVATLLDQDEAYRRALAMYEDGATFHRPPPALAPARPARTSTANQPTLARPVEAGMESRRMNRWATALPSVVLGVLVVFWRFQRTKRNLRWRAAGNPARSAGAASS